MSEVANNASNLEVDKSNVNLEAPTETEILPEVKAEDKLQNDAGNIKDEEEEDEEEEDDDDDEEEAAEEEEEDKEEGEVKEVAEEKVGFLAVVEEHTNENDQEEQEQVEEDEEGEEEDDEEEESEPEQFPRFDRERLVREYNKAVAEREALTKRNNNAQHKICELMKRRKQGAQEEVQEAQQAAQLRAGDQEQEQTYVKALMRLEKLMRQQEEERNENGSIVEEYKEMVGEKEEQVGVDVQEAQRRKRRAVLKAAFLNGRVITGQMLNQLEANEASKSAVVSVVRLDNIKLKNQVEKLTEKLRKKEELAEGLHLIDFEQLKIENQTYNEKIEERNEELLKLRKKITETVQVLTHMKEKLEFIEEENLETKRTLKVVEKQLSVKRDVINATKRAREDLRMANRKLNLKMGLLGMDDLLEDYEVSYDEDAEIQQRIGDLKMRHAELQVNIRKVKTKIRQAEKV